MRQWLIWGKKERNQLAVDLFSYQFINNEEGKKREYLKKKQIIIKDNRPTTDSVNCMEVHNLEQGTTIYPSKPPQKDTRHEACHPRRSRTPHLSSINHSLFPSPKSMQSCSTTHTTAHTLSVKTTSAPL